MVFRVFIFDSIYLNVFFKMLLLNDLSKKLIVQLAHEIRKRCNIQIKTHTKFTKHMICSQINRYTCVFNQYKKNSNYYIFRSDRLEFQCSFDIDLHRWIFPEPQDRQFENVDPLTV